MELKHSELLKGRLEDKLQTVKADRDEMVIITIMESPLLIRFPFFPQKHYLVLFFVGAFISISTSRVGKFIRHSAF